MWESRWVGGWVVVGGSTHSITGTSCKYTMQVFVNSMENTNTYTYQMRQREKKAETETKQKLEKVWSGKLLPRYLIEASPDNWCGERNQNTLKCNFQSAASHLFQFQTAGYLCSSTHKCTSASDLANSLQFSSHLLTPILPSHPGLENDPEGVIFWQIHLSVEVVPSLRKVVRRVGV